MAVLWQWAPKVWAFLLGRFSTSKPAAPTVAPEPVVINVTVNSEKPATTEVTAPTAEGSVEVNKN